MWHFLSILLFVSGNLYAGIASSEEAVSAPKETACVSWAAKKSMFFLFGTDVVGENCKVSLEIKEQGKDRNVRVLIPISGFSSGNQTRDAEVAQLLGGDKADAQMLFEAVMTSPIDIHPTEIKGSLVIQEQSHEVTFKVEKSSREEGFLATWSGKLSDLKLKAPKVAGGLVASVHDDIQLKIEIKSEEFANVLKALGVE